MTSLFKSVLSIVTGRLSRIMAGVIYTPVLVRLLSQDEYGAYANIIAIVGIITVISPVGLFDSIRKYVAEYQKNPTEQTSIITSGLALSVGYSLLFAAGLYLLLPIFDLIRSKYIYVIITILIVNNIYQVIRGTFHGVQQEHITEFFDSARKITYITLSVIFVILGYSINGILWGYLIALMTITPFAMIVGYRQIQVIQIKNLWKDSLGKVQTVSRYGAVQAIGGVSAMLLYKVDIVLVDQILSSSKTALYQAALVPSEFIWLVPSSIQVALLQNISSLVSNSRMDKASKNISNAFTYSTLSLILFSVGLFVLAEDFVIFYFGSAYAASALPLRLLIIGTFLFGVVRIIVSPLQATGWLWYTEGLSFVVLVINIVLNLLLIPVYGVVGAAVGTTVSYVFMFGGSLILWWKSEFSLPRVKPVFLLFVLFILFLSLFSLIYFISNFGTIDTLLILPPVGLSLFSILAHILGIINLTRLRQRLANLV